MIFVLSGPSGSGKTTLRDILLKEKALKGKFIKSVSLATRPRRSGERHGKDYFFTTNANFLKLRQAKKILEWTRYLGYYYGTKKEPVDHALASGRHMLLCLDHRGALRIKKIYGRKAATVFILPPSIKELRRRIEARCAATKKEEVAKRLSLAKDEVRNSRKYDYVLRNTNLKAAVKRLKAIILNNTRS